MKKIFLILALLWASSFVHATDIAITGTTVAAAQFKNLGNNVSLPAVSVTNSSTAVTCTNCIPSQYVGLGGFLISLAGTDYEVQFVTSTSALALKNVYIGSTATVAATIYPLVELRIYSDRTYWPRGAAAPILEGSENSGFFWRYGCTAVNNTIRIPDLTIPATTDAANPSERFAKLTAIFFRLNGGRLDTYNFCGSNSSFGLQATPTTQTWGDICTYTTPTARVLPDYSTLTADQIRSLMTTRGNIAGTYRRLGLIGATGGNVENSALYQDGSGNVAAENNLAIGGAATVSGALSAGSEFNLLSRALGSVPSSTNGALFRVTDTMRGIYLRGATGKLYPVQGSLNADEFVSIDSAITTGLASVRTLKITSAQTLIADQTIAANRSLEITGDGGITIPTGKTLTITGSFLAGNYQVFTLQGTGKVSFTNPTTINPVWFGAIPGDGTTDSAAMQAAVDAAPNNGSAVIQWGGVMTLDASLNILGDLEHNYRMGLTLQGLAPVQSGGAGTPTGIDWKGDDDDPVVKCWSRNVIFKDLVFTVLNPYSTPAVIDIDNSTSGTNYVAATGNTVENCYIQSAYASNPINLMVNLTSGSGSVAAQSTASGTLASSGVNVTGTGTDFSELGAGQKITASGQTRTVDEVIDTTHLKTTVAFSPVLSGASFTHGVTFDSSFVGKYLIAQQWAGSFYQSPLYGKITTYTDSTHVTINTNASVTATLQRATISNIGSGVRLGKTATGNCDYMDFIGLYTDGTCVGVENASTTGQVKSVTFRKGSLAWNGYAATWKTGSFSMDTTGVAYSFIAAIGLASVADPINLDKLDSEGCARLILNSGNTNGLWNINVTNGRFATQRMAFDGHYIYLRNGGPLRLAGNIFEPLIYKTFDIYASCPSPGAAVESSGNTFPTNTPFATAIDELNSFSDKGVDSGNNVIQLPRRIKGAGNTLTVENVLNVGTAGVGAGYFGGNGANSRTIASADSVSHYFSAEAQPRWLIDRGIAGGGFGVGDGTNSIATEGVAFGRPSARTVGLYYGNGTSLVNGFQASAVGAILPIAGQSLQLKGGTNACIGTATLVAGTVTASTTCAPNPGVTGIVQYSRRTAGGTTGDLSYSTVTGTSITFTSTSGTDTSVIDWVVIKQN